MNIIKSSEEIGLIFQEGKRISLPDLTLIIKKLSSQCDHSGRVAFIAGRKNGNAVWRNRAKRRMRALYRDIYTQYSTILNEYDLLLIARRHIDSVSYQHLYNQLQKSVTRMRNI